MVEKENDDYAKNAFGMQVAEWKQRSECGDVCGIFGCEDKPTIHCHHCGNWYCNDHSLIHFHAV